MHDDFCCSDRSIERLYWWRRQWRKLPGDTGKLVQFNISTECNILAPDSPLMKTCARELINAIYCIARSSLSVQQAQTCNFQKYRVTEQAVCTWVTSKLNYWYIRDVCSVASHVKVYQDLPLLTFRHCHVGENLGTRLALLLSLRSGRTSVKRSLKY